MFHEHNSSHLDTASPGLGADPSTSAPIIAPAPPEPPPTVPASPITLQHILIIGGIAALVFYLLTRSRSTKD